MKFYEQHKLSASFQFCPASRKGYLLRVYVNLPYLKGSRGRILPPPLTNFILLFENWLRQLPRISKIQVKFVKVCPDHLATLSAELLSSLICLQRWRFLASQKTHFLAQKISQSFVEGKNFQIIIPRRCML